MDSAKEYVYFTDNRNTGKRNLVPISLAFINEEKNNKLINIVTKEVVSEAKELEN